MGSGVSWGPDNGTAYLGASGALALSLVSGIPFSLLSLDVAEDSIYRGYPRTFEVIGYTVSGATVTNDLTIDGIIDGPGPLRDFQTFALDTRFANLSRVAIPSGGGWGWSFDTVVLGVPEPSAGGLIVLGMLCGLGGRVLGRRRCQPD